LGFIAACTSQIELTTGVIVLPQRQTVLVAKQAAEVDVLSEGRLRLGIGVGWNRLEYEALNESFDDRGARQEEQVDLMRLLWTADTVEFHGRWHRIDKAGIRPRPARPIPIWFGGNHDAALRRAARLGAGWMPLLRPGEPLADELFPRLRRYLAEAGRDRSEFGIDGYVNYERPDSARWRRQLTAWQQAGATHVTLRTEGYDLGGPAGHLRAIQDWMTAMRPPAMQNANRAHPA
jgi:probable F420-dependent oxidoreductase